MKNGFTLIEILVVIVITAILSGVVMMGVTQFIKAGKDKSIIGNLAVLPSAGEAYYYNGNGIVFNSYNGFCGSSVVVNAKDNMPENKTGACYNSTTNKSGLCCGEDTIQNYQAWAACATLLSDTSKAYCVDNRGVAKEINNSDCKANIIECPNLSTP